MSHAALWSSSSSMSQSINVPSFVEVRSSLCSNLPFNNIGETIPRGSKIELTVARRPRRVKGRSGTWQLMVSVSVLVFQAKQRADCCEFSAKSIVLVYSALSEGGKGSRTSLENEQSLCRRMVYSFKTVIVSWSILVAAVAKLVHPKASST